MYISLADILSYIYIYIYITQTGLHANNIRIIIWTRRKIKKHFFEILLSLLPCYLLLANLDIG